MDETRRPGELELRIRRAFGNRPRRWKKPSRTAARCWLCDGTLGPRNVVYRTRVRLGRGLYGGTSWTVVPLCRQCRPSGPEPWQSWSWDRGPKPCQTCGRPVLNQVTRRMRHHTFCSDACEEDYHAARQAAERREARDREKECKACADEFTASRKDAKFCSDACRQKAYRRRKRESA
ncbi:MAG: hypothetical protein R3223_11510 [Longimicrobiales bacterium]|nr:hypothetical protein [Longimicrobiales bacterium]